MSEIADRLESELEKLKTRRDELRVQVDLGKKELEDAWEQADVKWNKLEAYVGRLRREGAEAIDEIGEAADLLVDELKDGYKRLRELI